MTTIESLLNRRLDLSTFLVHFTRNQEDTSARDNLLNILSERRLNAVTKLGKAKDREVPGQEVVCFTETPLEHSWTFATDIQGRQIQLEPYGVVFTKIWARQRGLNPVWYIDATPGHHWLVNHVDVLMNRAIAEQRYNDEIFQLTPFFEVMGTWQSSRSEFWWEREWRKVGALTFAWDDLVSVLAPETDHLGLRDDLRVRHPDSNVDGLHFLDPAWGLERMIGSLAGIAPDHLGPLPRFPAQG